MHKWRLICVCIITFVLTVAAVAVIIYGVEALITLPQTRTQYHFFMQILTGNWSAPPFEYGPESKTSSIHYGQVKSALYLSLALVLNIGTIVALFVSIIKIFERLRATQEKVMNLENAIGLRDQIVTAYIVHSFPIDQQEDVRKTVMAAFQRASNAWVEKYLTELMPEKAEEIKESLQKSFPHPEP